ncbi:hypothetical protein KBC79_02195 [Candidatus Woesebacteria bacterium]|nr:hypothetical protein [Candidatus Woesebacteria bacterium]
MNTNGIPKLFYYTTQPGWNRKLWALLVAVVTVQLASALDLFPEFYQGVSAEMESLIFALLIWVPFRILNLALCNISQWTAYKYRKPWLQHLLAIIVPLGYIAIVVCASLLQGNAVADSFSATADELPLYAIMALVAIFDTIIDRVSMMYVIIYDK